jgi:hypothetical protein
MLGKDDFYWFTIHTAPSDGVHEMTEEEIEKYKLLTKPIITKNLTKTDNLPATFSNKFGRLVFGDISVDTIIINSQGGPVLDFYVDEIYDILVDQAEIDVKKVAVVSVHQEQTLKP